MWGFGNNCVDPFPHSTRENSTYLANYYMDCARFFRRRGDFHMEKEALERCREHRKRARHDG